MTDQTLGPLRLAPSVVTMPGSSTVDYKSDAFDDLRVPIAIGIGNRSSDIAAYTNAGLSADRILILSREFADEVRGPLDTGRAVGFQSYDKLSALLPR